MLVVAVVPTEEDAQRLADVIHGIESMVSLGARVDDAEALPVPGRPPDVYTDPLLRVDFRQCQAQVEGRELALTPLEFRLLAALVRHPNRVVSHGQLVELAWGGERLVSREQLRLEISYLRRKLGPEGRLSIETVRGFGYRYQPGQ